MLEGTNMRKDNRGLTLIELIIAITMATIILGAVGLFLINAMRSYDAATSNIDLQMEAHVMMEQIGSWIMEGNRIEVADHVTVDMGSNTSTVDKVLVIYQIPRTSDVDRLPSGLRRDAEGNLITNFDPTETAPPITASKRLIWMQDGRLYTKIVKGIADFDNDVTIRVEDVDSEGNCFCEYMESFEPGWDPDKATVSVMVGLKAGKQDYQLENEFRVRNEIQAAPTAEPELTPEPGPGI